MRLGNRSLTHPTVRSRYRRAKSPSHTARHCTIRSWSITAHLSPDDGAIKPEGRVAGKVIRMSPHRGSAGNASAFSAGSLLLEFSLLTDTFPRSASLTIRTSDLRHKRFHGIFPCV